MSGQLPPRTAVAMTMFFALAFGLYSAVWPEAPVLEGDSAEYLAVARDLADGRLEALHFRTPGYPLLLALTGSTAEPTRLLFRVSLLLHFASVWMLVVALHRAGAGGMWLLGFCLLLLLPPYVEPAASVMTENFAQATLVTGLASLLTWERRRTAGWAAAAAVAFSFSALIRPVYQGLVPTLCLALLLLPLLAVWSGVTWRTAARAVPLLLVVWLAILGGYAAFNLARFDWFGVAPSAGMHLSTKTMGFVERLPDEYAAVREVLIRHRDAELIKPGGTHTGSQAIWAARPELEEVTGLSMQELSSFLVRMNVALIRRAPIEFLQEVARSAAVYWFPAAGRLASMNSPILRWLWVTLHLALVLLFFMQLAALVGIGALAITGGQPAARGLVAGISRHEVFAFGASVTIVVYTMALTCLVDIGEPRQRRATDVLFVFACLLGAFVWRRARRAASLRPAP